MNPLTCFPIVYSCSGCSSAAQSTTEIARRLERRSLAEWSCIAGVGGGVPALVALAVSGRPIIAVDGCHLECVKACLARYNVQPAVHYRVDLNCVTTLQTKRHAALGRELVERIAAATRKRVAASEAPLV
ncbi:MAG: putative zinc-binding protein [Pseudomonadota bacterium]|nr:MAG: zinc-binding protein [Pseudomonadota bacterium]